MRINKLRWCKLPNGVESILQHPERIRRNSGDANWRDQYGKREKRSSLTSPRVNLRERPPEIPQIQIEKSIRWSWETQRFKFVGRSVRCRPFYTTCLESWIQSCASCVLLVSCEARLGCCVGEKSWRCEELFKKSLKFPRRETLRMTTQRSAEIHSTGIEKSVSLCGAAMEVSSGFETWFESDGIPCLF